MNFELSKSIKPRKINLTNGITPEGSDALTMRQLELLQYRKQQCGISDEEYTEVIMRECGIKEDFKIPFKKVGDVLGGLDRLGEAKRASQRGSK